MEYGFYWNTLYLLQLLDIRGDFIQQHSESSIVCVLFGFTFVLEIVVTTWIKVCSMLLNTFHKFYSLVSIGTCSLASVLKPLFEWNVFIIFVSL